MIRLIQHTDAERLFDLVSNNREYLRQWLPWLDVNKTLENTRQFISTSLKDCAENKSMVHVIIDNKNDIIGVCGFNSINHTIKAGYIGYWIAENKQGKGHVTSCCADLEKIGFELLNLNKIEIHVAIENIKSRKIAEKLGSVETGHILDAEWLYDHYVDHVVYSKRK